MSKTAPKPPQIFISYSHKDETYLEELRAHLSPLERNGKISPWDDRALVAGEKLDEELLKHLQSADLVAFLVSADFIQSVSCYEDELVETLDRRSHEHVEVVPIILRKCLWKNTAIGKFVAATKNGKAVTSYSDRDSAWVEVVQQIEKIVTKLQNSQGSSIDRVNVNLVQSSPEIKQSFDSWLNGTEVVFQHKFKENLLLRDLFVYPDLRGTRTNYDEFEEMPNSSLLVKIDNITDGVLIHGDEQSGKTSLIKILFREYYEQGFLPLFANAKDISTADPKRALDKRVSEQYENLEWETYVSVKKSRILFVDNLHQIKLNIRYQQKFLMSVKKSFDYVVLMADSSLTFDEQRMAELAGYDQWEILPFGHARRGELIERWNSLGQKETIDANVLHRQNDITTRHINSIIRKNLLPQKPIYVLTILQLLDSGTSTNFTLTSYGYCYQVLIQQALQKLGVRPQEFDHYVNYLSELAYFVFSHGDQTLTKSQFGLFKDRYSANFLLKSHDDILQTLHKAEILRSEGDQLRFSYKYIFYFYTAKYLADHLVDVEKDVETLCEKMHTEKNANILIFLMHHTRDQRVIDDVLLRAHVIFDGLKPAKLDNEETNHILEFVESVPDLVIEHRDVESERRQALEREDAIESELNDLNEEEGDEVIESDELLADIARSARMIDVVGQILRNRSGSLHKNQLIDLARSGYESGLKFLTFWLDLTKREKTDQISIIAEVLKEKLQGNEDNLRKAAVRMYLSLTYSICLLVVRRIANSLGSADLIEIFEMLEKEQPKSIAVRLINVAIRLEFTKSIPKIAVSRLNADLDSNPVGRRLLKELVMQHLYLNEVTSEEKHWISSKLGIPMSTQLLIGARKVTSPKKN